MCFQVTDLFYNTLSYILQIFNLLVLATQIGGIHPAIVEGQIKYHHI